ncbi:D-beta-D-heptose 1-phosphate adenosyltransferase, partial [Streptomyces sp. SID8455]|nr:D-beta-D-heptose 1-phosphate adenosyltransferase [Streptomyces sp. SID8455]
MYAPERQQEILRLAQESGRVDVLSLAEEFQVTA